ncbi:cytochrome P450 [Halomicrococcus sp. SG-WS-1]|uniref:cytochrome P450 n=1 Tax=Halomicrococcus sp. SG-WS-1 TaxID=3439057 RepID=UPI003F7A10D6
MANRVPSGPPGLPVVGTSLQYADDPLGFMERAAREFGDVASIDVYGQEVYQVVDPDVVRRVLVENADDYRKPTFGEDEGLAGLLGDGLLTSNGDVWRRQRSALQPAFFGERLNAYADEMVANAERTGASWSDGDVLDVHAEMSELTLRIVVETLLGVELDGMERVVRDALLNVGERFRPGPQAFVPEEVPTPRNLQYRRSVERLERVLRELRRQHEGREGDDVLAILLRMRDQDEVDEDVLRDEMMTMLLAGHDTTALTLTYVWWLVADHPAVERKFHEEVDALDGPPTADDLAELDYLENIVTEAMRLYPPAYVVYREATVDDELAGFRIPQGSVVSMPQWVVHRDRRWFDDPETFRPERWTDEFRRDLPPFAYFPFGGGPRKCIGDGFAMREAKLVLATLGRRYELDRVTEDVDLVPLVTLHPDGPVEMRVTER